MPARQCKVMNVLHLRIICFVSMTMEKRPNLLLRLTWTCVCLNVLRKFVRNCCNAWIWTCRKESAFFVAIATVYVYAEKKISYCNTMQALMFSKSFLNVSVRTCGVLFVTLCLKYKLRRKYLRMAKSGDDLKLEYFLNLQSFTLHARNSWLKLQLYIKQVVGFESAILNVMERDKITSCDAAWRLGCDSKLYESGSQRL